MINIKIKKLREELWLTQQQMADYLNVERSTYSYYEKGKTLPSLRSIIKLSEIFNISLDYILNDKISSTKHQDVNDIFQKSNKEECEMLFYFRMLSSSSQKKVIDILRNMYKGIHLRNSNKI